MTESFVSMLWVEFQGAGFKDVVGLGSWWLRRWDWDGKKV